MPADLRCLIDNRHPYMVARIAGRLDSVSAEMLHKGLLKCPAEQPEALIVDLTDMRLADRQALSVLLAVARQTAIWPRVPMILCGAAPAVAHLLRSRWVDRRIPTVRDISTAVRSIAHGEAPVAPH
jgi:anti-anti-sigma factor